MLTTDQKGVLAEQAIVFEALKLGVGVSSLSVTSATT
jgi:hypothetical protein